MSTPGADPLAAIRQRATMSEELGHVSAPSVDRATLLALWDTHQSALRALVAQWRVWQEQPYDLGQQQEEAYRECADALERLLSGPQL